MNPRYRIELDNSTGTSRYLIWDTELRTYVRNGPSDPPCAFLSEENAQLVIGTLLNNPYQRRTISNNRYQIWNYLTLDWCRHHNADPLTYFTRRGADERAEHLNSTHQETMGTAYNWVSNPIADQPVTEDIWIFLPTKESNTWMIFNRVTQDVLRSASNRPLEFASIDQAKLWLKAGLRSYYPVPRHPKRTCDDLLSSEPQEAPKPDREALYDAYKAGILQTPPRHTIGTFKYWASVRGHFNKWYEDHYND